MSQLNIDFGWFTEMISFKTHAINALTKHLSFLLRGNNHFLHSRYHLKESFPDLYQLELIETFFQGLKNPDILKLNGNIIYSFRSLSSCG